MHLLILLQLLKNPYHLKLVLAIVLIILLRSYTPANADQKGDVVILFDQSASMQLYSPTFVASRCLLPLMNIFPKPCNMVLVGFDDRTQDPIRISNNDEEGLAALQAKLEENKPSGLTTDLEAPLRFLLEYENDIAMVIIITDGEPEIWDDYQWYLSNYIQTDKRYQDLNTEYSSLKSTKLSGEVLYQKLGKAYFKRNIDLIEMSLAKLRHKLGSRLIFLDTCGKYDYLKRWSDMAAGQLIVEPFPSKKIKPDELITKINVLQQKVQLVAEEQLELSAKQEPELTTEQPSNHTTAYLYFLILAVGIVASISIIILFMRRKHKRSRIGAKTIVSREGKEVPLLSRSTESITSYIKSEVDRALADTNKLRHKYVPEGGFPFFDRRISLRVHVPEGTMMIYWKDKSGEEKSRPAVDISIDWVSFRAMGFDGESIEKIHLPHINKTFHIKHSTIQRKDTERVVIKIGEFADIPDDRIHWIELLTRIEEAA